MNPREVTSADQARTLIQNIDPKHVKVGVFDLDGILRGKYMSKEKFLSALDGGFGFCDVVLGWDMRDQLYDNVKFTGWHTGYPDAQAEIIPDSCRTLPLENDTLFFLAQFAGEAENLCPRGVLRKVIQRAKELGFDAFAGFEYEFFVFDETPHSVREKQYQNLTPSDPGEFGYSVIRNSAQSELYQSLLKLCDQMDFPLEGLHEETGPGVMEAAIAYDEALNSADKAALFKTFTKIALQKQGKMATFMARWSDTQPGQSGHIHLSLKNQEGKSAFYDESQPHNMSSTMKQFVAGQQLMMPQILSMIAPTINSYRRLIPGFWAPTHSTVGVDNRTCAIRIIPGSEKSQRLEYRIASADGNPYLVLAAVIASGLWGIQNNAQLPELVKGNAYDQKFPDELNLPKTLWDAAQVIKRSKMARDFFGDGFVDHYAASREWEEREYRKHISQWELDRYFEII